MSDQQILSSNTHEVVPAKAEEIVVESKPKSRDGSKGRRSRRNGQKTEVQKASDAEAKEEEGSSKNSPRDTSQVLIGRRPASAYVNLLKNILAQKHEVVHLEGVGKGGNSKVI